MNNIFLKSTVSLLKIIVLAVLAYLFIGLFFAENNTQLAVGFFVLIFITLPTIFLFFFKKKFLVKHLKFVIFWKIILIIYVISIILYVGFWLFGVWHLNEVAKTQKTIDFINSKKITLDDVMGENLPPAPDQKLNDSTIAGIDVNKNYIRDDVELAIFEEYLNSAKIRAAELQYAQALQLELTQVFNSKTLVATLQKGSFGIDCIGETGPKINLKNPHEKIIADYAVSDNRIKEIGTLVLNTDMRKKKQSDVENKYTTTYLSPGGEQCDIELSSLSN